MLFTQSDEFKQEKAASKDVAIYDTVELIAQYFSQVTTIKQFKRDYEITNLFAAFNSLGRRISGTIVYAIKSLNDLPPDNAEKIAVLDLSLTISTLYGDPYAISRDHLLELLNQFNTLLDTYSNDTSDKVQAQKLCVALYFLVTIMQTSMQNPGAAVSAVLWKRGIDEARLVATIDQLLVKIEATFDKIGRPRSDSPVVVNEIQDVFNHRYQAAFARCSLHNVAPLLQEITAVETSLNALVQQQQEANTLHEKIDSVNRLFQAFKTNEAKVLGRQSFLDLFDAHQPAFKHLLQCGDSPEKQKLVDNIEILASPDAVTVLRAQAIATLRASTQWLSAAYRTVTPARMQQFVAARVPTLDGESRAETLSLANQYLVFHNQQLGEVDKKISATKLALFTGFAEYVYLLNDENTDRLNGLLTQTRELKKAVATYQQVSHLKEDHATLKQFLVENDGFWVKLSLLFSKISSLFKTATASSVENSRALIGQLQQLEQDYTVDADSKLAEQPALKQQMKDLVRDAGNVQPRAISNLQVHSIFNKNARGFAVAYAVEPAILAL